MCVYVCVCEREILRHIYMIGDDVVFKWWYKYI